MLYQLVSGKTIELTFEQWLNLTDEDVEYLVAYGHGEETNNPWKSSVLTDHFREYDKDVVVELPDIPIEERMSDPDLLTTED